METWQELPPSLELILLGAHCLSSMVVNLRYLLKVVLLAWLRHGLREDPELRPFCHLQVNMLDVRIENNAVPFH